MTFSPSPNSSQNRREKSFRRRECQFPLLTMLTLSPKVVSTLNCWKRGEVQGSIVTSYLQTGLFSNFIYNSVGSKNWLAGQHTKPIESPNPTHPIVDTQCTFQHLHEIMKFYKLCLEYNLQLFLYTMRFLCYIELNEYKYKIFICKHWTKNILREGCLGGSIT